MTDPDVPEETTVSDRGMVTIPASLRDELDIEAGDRFRWSVAEDGTLSVEVIRQRSGAFDDFEAVRMGGDALETHDWAGHVEGHNRHGGEDDSTGSEDT